jgi:hypothetical protein
MSEVKARTKWSFSALKQFINCPRQYNEVKRQQRYVQPVSHQMRYGTDVHEALELYGRDGVPLPKFYAKFQPMVDALLNADGEKYFEYEMALTQDKQPCAFNAPDYWVRGIADLLVVDDDAAFIVDYKTGSAKYPDMKQLQLMALMTFAHMPKVKLAKAGLLFLSHNAFITNEFRVEDSDYLWSMFEPDLIRLDEAVENEHWQPNPTPLCGWCPVKSCEYHRG